MLPVTASASGVGIEQARSRRALSGRALIGTTEFDIFSINPSTCAENWRSHEEYPAYILPTKRSHGVDGRSRPNFTTNLDMVRAAYVLWGDGLYNTPNAHLDALEATVRPTTVRPT